MPRTRVLALGVVSGLCLVSALAACAGLKRADEEVPPGGTDADVEDGADAGPRTGDDGSLPDVGPPPTDFSCGAEPWVKATKTKPECAPRTVTVVDTEPAEEPTGVSIARTKAGRVGIAYYSAHFADEGELRVAHFASGAAPFTATVATRFLGQFSKAGYAARMVATGNDTLEILTHDVYDANGDVNVVRLVDGKLPFTNPETVLTAVQTGTQLGFAADPSGTLYATVLRVEKVDGGPNTTGKVVARKKVSGAAFASMPDVVVNMTPKEAPEVGASSVVVDPGGQLHVVVHYSEGFSHSTPRYYTFDGSSWSYRKTLDNAIPDGLSGFSPAVGVYGTKKHAAFFFKKSLQGAPETADLRLATWQGENDTPTIEILDQSIPSPDEGAVFYAPAYRVAMAVDKFGLVHLAIVRPENGTATSGSLFYRRQVKDETGAIKWLEDTVDPDVLSETSRAFVDLLVDENARPHIAYRSGKDGKVRYATRTDR